MNNPVLIAPNEWWYCGRFIQKNEHPSLSRYVSFDDNADTGNIVAQHRTMLEAKEYCIKHPCVNPVHKANDYLK